MLDREGELVIAKKMKRRNGSALALVEVPVAVEELIQVGEGFRSAASCLKDVVKVLRGDDPSRTR
jgi:RNA polymerase primary sigma factor